MCHYDKDTELKSNRCFGSRATVLFELHHRGLDGRYELLTRYRFYEVCAGARGHSIFHGACVAVCRENNDRHGPAIHDLFCCLDSIEARHVKIHEYKVRLQIERQLNSSRTLNGFADNFVTSPRERLL